MDKNSWKSAVLDVIRRIADESYQRTAWFGEGPYVSSPEEIYCELFDDYIYDDFLGAVDVDMTSQQRVLGVELRDVMNKYADSVEYLSDPRKVSDDPQWEVVRKAARAFLDSFKE